MTILALTATLAASNANAAVPYRAEGDIQQARKEIRRLWGAQARAAMCIVNRESGWKPTAINWNDRHANGRGSFGLFQLGRIHIGMVGGDWRRFLDPLTNVRVAHRLYLRAGWGPWGGGC